MQPRLKSVHVSVHKYDTFLTRGNILVLYKGCSLHGLLQPASKLT